MGQVTDVNCLCQLNRRHCGGLKNIRNVRSFYNCLLTKRSSLSETTCLCGEMHKPQPTSSLSELLSKARRLAQRKRAAAACLPCKSAKTKCSDYRPCSRCIKDEQRCIEPKASHLIDLRCSFPSLSKRIICCSFPSLSKHIINQTRFDLDEQTGLAFF
jgi:hypothetical protein